MPKLAAFVIALAAAARLKSRRARGPSDATQKMATGISVAHASGGPGTAPRPKEDRVVRIDDLEAHVRKSYSPALSEPPPPRPPSQFPPGPLRLYAVFDGHCGSLAATFCQARLPYELCATAEFARGDFPAALTRTFANLHAALLAAPGYSPEAPLNDFSSGCTASVALVTPTDAHFAAVGDSPILVWRRSDPAPDILLPEMDIENADLHEHVLSSNIFLVAAVDADFEGTHFLVSGSHRKAVLEAGRRRAEAEGGAAGKFGTGDDDNEDEVTGDAGEDRGKARATAANEGDGEGEPELPPPLAPPGLVEDPSSQPGAAAGADAGPSAAADPEADVLARPFDDVRLGLSALNVWGSIGDSIYDPDVFNPLVNLILEYRRLRSEAWHAARAEQAPADTRKRKRAFSAAPGAPHAFDFDTDPRLLPSRDPLDDPAGTPYTDFRRFAMARPEWKRLRHHVSLLPKESSMSRVLLALLRHPNPPLLSHPALVREPFTASVPLADLRVFLVCSDGVVRSYRHRKAAFDAAIEKDMDDPRALCMAMMGGMRWLGDDRSCIVVRMADGESEGGATEADAAGKGKKKG
ncbi:hypothetical protein DFJ74DRAFT_763097 [Hyaloraphidium curvatum]|nr:hypothetical protein DFJ74DRAFT_763097 [Hyaloraphidium curvatum]